MARIAVRLISIAIVVLSALWLYAEGGYEPLITTLVGIGGLVSSFFIHERRSEPAKRSSRVEKLVVESPDILFESEFWPEEGLPEFRAKTPHIVLRERPSADSPVCREIDLPLSMKLEFSAFRYRTLRSGIVVAQAPGKLHARSYGRASYISRENYYESYAEYRDYTYEEGDAFEYLQYRAEGSGFIRWNGEILDAELPWAWGKDSSLRLQSEPEAEGWIQLLGTDRRPIGWLLVGEFAEEVGRTL